MCCNSCLQQLFIVVLKPPKNNKKIGSKEGEYEGLYVAYFQKRQKVSRRGPDCRSKRKSVLLAISLIEHVLSILASLCRNLTGNQRSRLIQKFVEDDHIKVREQLAFKFLFLWMST